MNNNLTYNTIKEAYFKKGYRFHTEKNMLNLGGIRKKNGIINKFDDILFEAYIDETGLEILNVYQGTTDPGLKYLKNPMNPRGCAAIVEGQHLNCRTIGKHRGDHWALVQVGNITVYRDNNKDSKYDFIPSSIEIGCGFGLNRHRAQKNTTTEDINGYSAGCEVFKNSSDQEKEIELARKQVKLTGNKYFDETLFLEEEI